MPLAVDGGGVGDLKAVQMTWQSKLLKRKRGSPPLGLRNLGNSCYLNSVLQCLTHTPPLANFCVKYLHSSSCDLAPVKDSRGKKGDCPFCILEKRIARSLSSEAVADTPLQMNNCLRIFAEHFRIGRQEDAHEFLRYVIDACHNTCLRLKTLQEQHFAGHVVENGSGANVSGETVVKDIFGGALKSQIKCLSCGAESNKVDDIMDISLDILRSGSLVEALTNFFEPEILDGNNKYKCDGCKELVAAKKQMLICQAPNILVVQLKRFGGTFGGKVDKDVTFEDTLVLSSNMCNESEDLQQPEYGLFGTIVHSGFSPDSGHYYAYIKDASGLWYCCNDNCVTASTLQEVLSEKVYVLFFSRTKQTSVRLENSVKDHISEPKSSTETHNPNGTGLGIARPVGLDKVHAITPSSCLKTTSKDSQVPSERIRNPPPIPIEYLQRQAKASTNGSNSQVPSSRIRNPPPIPLTYLERQAAAAAKGSNCRVSSAENSVANLHSEASVSNEQRKSGDDVGPTKLVAHENVKLSIFEKEPEVDKGFEGSLVNSVKNGGGEKIITKETPDVPVITGQSGVQSGADSVPSSEKSSVAVITTVASVRNDNHKDLQSGNIMGSGTNVSRKRKEEDTPSIFFARDDQSRAKMNEFKEMMAKETSSVLRSCGWYIEVENSMHARKKLLQEPGSSEMRDANIKSELISHAKKSCLPKVPESLKAMLVDCLKKLNEEHKPAKA